MMELLPLVTGGLLIVLAALLVAYPLWQQTRPSGVLPANISGQTLAEHQVRYQAALAAIKDLMFDYEMGKISAEDHQLQLHKAKVEAAAIKRQIDLLDQNGAAPPLEATLDAEIERLVAQTKTNNPANRQKRLLAAVQSEIDTLKAAAPAGPACGHCGKSCQPEDAFCSGCGQPVTQENICPQCGQSHQPEDSFCVTCGAALATSPAGQKAALVAEPTV